MYLYLVVKEGPELGDSALTIPIEKVSNVGGVRGCSYFGRRYVGGEELAVDIIIP